MQFKITTNADAVRRSLQEFQRKQIPFAISQALNEVAREVARAEVLEIARVMPTAKPFTLQAVGMSSARKTHLEATIFMREIAAGYLRPYLTGATRALFGGRQTVQTPTAAIALDQYGNLGKGRVQRLAARPDHFIGTITFKSGESVTGLWKRPKRGTRRAGGHGTKGHTKRKVGGVLTGLQLLVRFDKPDQVKQRLEWHAVAERVVRTTWAHAFDRAFKRAIETAKR